MVLLDMLRISKSRVRGTAVFGIAALSLMLQSCATVDDPRDCGVGCAFGGHERFEVENEELERSVQEAEASSESVLQSLAAAKARRAKLEQQSASLKAEVSTQSLRLTALSESIADARMQKQLSEAEFAAAQADIDALQLKIAELDSMPASMTQTEMQNVSATLESEVLPGLSNLAALISVDELGDDLQ